MATSSLALFRVPCEVCGDPVIAERRTKRMHDRCRQTAYRDRKRDGKPGHPVRRGGTVEEQLEGAREVLEELIDSGHPQEVADLLNLIIRKWYT